MSNTAQAPTAQKTYADAAEPSGSDHGVTPADRLKELQESRKLTNGESHGGSQEDQQKVKSAKPSKPSKASSSVQHNNAQSDTKKQSPPTEAVQKPKKSKQSDPSKNAAGQDVKQRPESGPVTSLDGQQQAHDPLVSGRHAGASWQRSKIRWAPLNVPLQRRLQTLTVLAHGLSIVGLLAVFLFLCAIPLLWPILVPYLIYCLFSQASVNGKLNHRSERLRRSPIWSLFASYFPARLHRSAELEPTRKYIFGYHPHGIISHGAFAAFSTEALGFSQLFPGITNTLLTLDANFRIPLYRDYALAMGLQSVSRESCEALLNHGGPNGEGMGRAITIVVGGARESLDAEPSSLRLVLKRRKGFVKLAMRNGADLVPVLGFGENDLYEQFSPDAHPFVHRLQMMVKSAMGFTVPLFHARGIFNYDVGLLPYRRPVNVVVGRPIRVEQNRKPDDKLVDELHEKYIEELLRLWDENKDVFAKERTSELEIIE